MVCRAAFAFEFSDNVTLLDNLVLQASHLMFSFCQTLLKSSTIRR